MTKKSIIIIESLVRSGISGLMMQIFLWQGAQQSTSMGLSEEEISGIGFRHFELLKSSKQFTFLLGLITELHRVCEIKFPGKNEDAEEDKYLIRGGFSHQLLISAGENSTWESREEECSVKKFSDEGRVSLVLEGKHRKVNRAHWIITAVCCIRNEDLSKHYGHGIAQLNALINMLLGELTPGDHQNIMTMCTIDVHARDVVATLIAHKCNKKYEANDSSVQETRLVSFDKIGL
ncbi:hypothetical protein BTVI_129571 [Pitangus sulphuratus]|nr:hypothetical protein BTVI_129571 [Pitangus sulphuratus]